MGKKKGPARRLEITFDEEKRRDYLTGFHKRKLQRRKDALEEIKRKIKQEQKKMKEERHNEYMKMLKEREDALEEADEIERFVTAKTESFQYDHPNHTVTVTTISDLDLSGVGLLPPDNTQENEETEQSEEQKTSYVPLPKKAGDPLLSKKISSLTASLHSRTKRKTKKRPLRNQENKKQAAVRVSGRTSKAQRRRQTGKAEKRRV
ncbi:nucleolar protein 12 [Bombina bombina]|uniref:nucleolar protein 12 n=1 Tax=Bombina bombina TaxID=8345 RepID=UPI00235AAE59|nr:nucleolar protein 12 [Bombina bombina]